MHFAICPHLLRWPAGGGLNLLDLPKVVIRVGSDIG